MKKHYDIIIVGAGPSGLSTALHFDHFAKVQEKSILILEKARHPRPKLCAGGILVEGERVLAKLGLDLCEVPHVDVDRALFNYKGHGLVARFFNKKPIFRTVRRNEFDAWLANKVKERDIEIQEETTVIKVESFDDYALVKTNEGEFHAKVVVGADGSNSKVRASVAKSKRPHVGRALEVITPVRSTSQATPTQPSPARGGLSVASFDFHPVPNGISGYLWDFPAKIDGEPMRCWGIYDSNIVKRKERVPLRQILAEEMAESGYDLDDYELKGHPIRWYDAGNQASAPRVILVGDALGVDALLGEGISPALGYGRIAAEEILRAFEKDDFSFRGYGERLLRSRLGGALWRRTFIAKIFYRLNTSSWQRIIWHYFSWLAGLLGAIFVVGWEKKEK